ncbi:hypothetical protein BV394_05390 [Brevirhabdus pacifica]|uniref:Uncharacterized protein n=1 Tax=Brevirhabdus pacifica TaxID=1267768 RepID=A0A1U7DH61_9RHOB|nr:hypothetical protein BV394_05390 [Brevirhabdus pacifica]OWU76735.1 hypothetical protein ATO5_10895 [Loktanella sp. 22II-4b]
MPVPTLCLQARRGHAHPAVLSDGAEVMPELPLGDVIAEELGLDVPHGTLIVIGQDDPYAAWSDGEGLSYHVGELVAEVLLDVIRQGVFPLRRENDALYFMACSFHRLAGAAGFQHLGLVPAAFRTGLAATLGAYWTGVRSSRHDMSGMFLEPNFLESERLKTFLRSVDAGFSAPDVRRAPAGLMLFAHRCRSYEAWLKEVELRVSQSLASLQTGSDMHLMRAS